MCSVKIQSAERARALQPESHIGTLALADDLVSLYPLAGTPVETDRLRSHCPSMESPISLERADEVRNRLDRVVVDFFCRERVNAARRSPQEPSATITRVSHDRHAPPGLLLHHATCRSPAIRFIHSSHHLPRPYARAIQASASSMKMSSKLLVMLQLG